MGIECKASNGFGGTCPGLEHCQLKARIQKKDPQNTVDKILLEQEVTEIINDQNMEKCPDHFVYKTKVERYKNRYEIEFDDESQTVMNISTIVKGDS